MTCATKNTVRNLADAEDSLSEVESVNFQRLTDKMLDHRLDDLTNQLEMSMVMSVRLTRVIRFSTDRPPFSWGFRLDNPPPKVAVLVDADRASDDTTGKCMSSCHMYLGLHATLVVARELESDRHKHEHGGHGHEALDHNWEDVDGIATVLWRERCGMVAVVAASRESTQTQSATTAARRCTTQQRILPRQMCRRYEIST